MPESYVTFKALNIGGSSPACHLKWWTLAHFVQTLAVQGMDVTISPCVSRIFLEAVLEATYPLLNLQQTFISENLILCCLE